jgi:oligopeptidase B
MSSTIKPQPPAAKKVPYRVETHGDVLVDPYFWMRDKQNPEVIEHLKAENAYTEAMLSDVTALREELFEEMKGRIKEDDAEVPYFWGGYYYYVRMVPGQQYALHCRKLKSLDAPEEILLDGNELAKGQKYFKLGVFEVSPKHDWLAYSADFDGSEKYTIFFKNLKTGELSPESIPGAAHSLEWANDNQTVFYNMLDEHERPDRVLKHVVGQNPSLDQLIYKETDSQLFVYCSKTRSERYLFIELQGKVTSELRFIDADHPNREFRVLEPRRRGVLYSAAHHGESFYILTNDKIQNFRLVQAPVTDPRSENWKDVLVGTEKVYLEDVEAFKSHMILHEREDGLPHLRVIDMSDMSSHRIQFPEPSYHISGQSNPEFDTEVFRFSYTSMITPHTVFDYDLRKRTRDIKKVQEIPSGYDKSLYRAERVYATSHDGTQVPISVMYRVDEKGEFKKDGSHPLYLYGYGSYGLSMSPTFSTVRLSLIDRGFVFAIAHIRGGSEMGRQWYENGKFLHKKNTFKDFIASAEHLIQKGFTKQGEIAIAGGSAGGMLMGAVINERPELFKASVAHVPFVDVINTMLDETLPLTTIEFEEWGNPKDPTYYHYMKSYSPYDNVKTQSYPHLLVTSGLNDPRVTYWEPAKWVAKLREMKTDQNLLLQHINMEAGHGGPSGRYENLKLHTLEYAFLLKVFDRNMFGRAKKGA